MLASTIQFSNNNPNQTKHPHNTDTQQDQDNNETPTLHTPKQHAKNSRKFQNPTTCTPNTTPTTTNVPHPPK